MPPSSAAPRPFTQVNRKLDLRLAAYTAAATGMSMLAAQPAEAKIVYTPAHVTIGPHTSFALDLNHDGVNDFIVSNWFYGHASHLSAFRPASANNINEVAVSVADREAVAAPSGIRIGVGQPFESIGFMAQQSSQSGVSSFADGPWKNARDRYLGFKFSVNGATHFGWARLTVTTLHDISAVLTGYAYETVPDRPIVTGQTSGTDEARAIAPNQMLAPSDRQTTLGMLARGSSALAIWRRKDEASTPLA